MIYNADLYSFKDTVSQGRTLWVRGGKTLRVCAFDGYFALTDYVDLDAASSPQFFRMELEDLHALKELLREDTGSFDLSDLPVNLAEEPFLGVMLEADSLCYPEGYLDPTLLDFFALSPDRLRKLSLLKPQKEYAIDCRVYKSEDPAKEPVIAFRYGPTVRGAMAPINRGDLQKIYTGEEIWR